MATERLLLRPLTAGDTDDLLAYRSDPEVCRYVPFTPIYVVVHEPAAAPKAKEGGDVHE